MARPSPREAPVTIATSPVISSGVRRTLARAAAAVTAAAVSRIGVFTRRAPS
jgi:hypothetical protein